MYKDVLVSAGQQNDLEGAVYGPVVRAEQLADAPVLRAGGRLPPQRAEEYSVRVAGHALSVVRERARLVDLPLVARWEGDATLLEADERLVYSHAYLMLHTLCCILSANKAMHWEQHNQLVVFVLCRVILSF